MKQVNIKMMIVALLLAIALAWGCKHYLPSIINAEKQCISPRVMDDISAELLHCYENLDRANQYFETCVNVYLQQGKTDYQ
ncbi:hypothetical protein CMI41_00925 [Candidatus Pacearchaeota archaeon]|nr:hypothetical protein [Candidatus Pacearchaeota archaeon]|tara:strand:+ start:6586 stop:6828 length:243 start_codon:yes stop_codon:yes gene_type:complete